MSKPKFTPGPWWIDDDNRPGMSWNRNIVHGTGENRICFMAHSDNKAPERDAANAHLIAAAPELYEALERLLSLLGNYVGWRNTAAAEAEEEAAENAAHAALAKARGKLSG